MAGSQVVREDVLPPGHIHRALHGLLQGHPQPALLPLLATKQARCVQRTCDILDLYTLLHQTNSACSFILAQSCATPLASRTGATSASDLDHATLARAAIQEGAQKLVLAMVDKVSSCMTVSSQQTVVAQWGFGAAWQQRESCGSWGGLSVTVAANGSAQAVSGK